MPELPEVETVRKGIEPLIIRREIAGWEVFQPRLRFPVDVNWIGQMQGAHVVRVSRRAKYLLFHLSNGRVLLGHLGMTGNFRVAEGAVELRKHDHIRLLFADGHSLVYHDPRRFGFLLLLDGEPEAHPLLAHLGPEPLGNGFSCAYLHQQFQRRSVPVKVALMDQRVVVGVGNIYASEALHRAGISVLRPANRVTEAETAALVDAVRAVFGEAIAKGGSTLKDFRDAEGRNGYFQHEFAVYGREKKNCLRCNKEIIKVIQANRSSFYCPSCQK